MGKLINEEFLDADSLEIDFAVHFRFNNIAMVLELYELQGSTFNIYKQSEQLNHLFQVSYNPKSQKPILAWENGIPEDIDIRVATDVVVAKIFQQLQENGLDLAVLTASE